MLMVANVAQKRRRAVSNTEHELFGIDKLDVVSSSIPAVTHVDYSRSTPRQATLSPRCGSPYVRASRKARA